MDNIEPQGDDAGDAEAPSEKNLSDLIVAINAITDKINSYSNSDEQEKRWHHAATIAAITYTIFTFVVMVFSIYQGYISRGQLAALQIQNDGQQRQLRPYIDVSAGSLTESGSTNTGPYANATIIVTDSGTTPALNGKLCYIFGQVDLSGTVAPVSVDMTPIHPSLTVPAFFNQEGDLVTKDASIYGSCDPLSESMRVYLPRMFDGNIQKISASQQTMWYGNGKDEAFGEGAFNLHIALLGNVTYSDGFGVQYETPFCFVYLKDGAPHKCSDYKNPT